MTCKKPSSRSKQAIMVSGASSTGQNMFLKVHFSENLILKFLFLKSVLSVPYNLHFFFFKFNYIFWLAFIGEDPWNLTPVVLCFIFNFLKFSHRKCCISNFNRQFKTKFKESFKVTFYFYVLTMSVAFILMVI